MANVKLEKIITEILWAIIKPFWYAWRFIKEFTCCFVEWLIDNRVLAMVLGFVLVVAWCYAMLWLECYVIF